MKKLFTVLCVAAASLVALPSQAQVSFGLKGGLNVTSMSLSSDVLDASNQAGFFIGPTVKFTLPVVGLGIDASALYDQRSAEIKGTNDKLKSQSIQIPVNLRYGVGLGDLASVYFFAGPQFGFGLGDKEKTLAGVGEWTLKSSNFSVNVGLGVMLINHLQLSANYNIACGKTGDVNVLNTTTSLVKGKANAWQIGLAYYF
ncbi:MAG: porin family protein [Prevotella sp.]|nr:porin family protein [Prevotella sp.]